jgi:hypothetical protein
VRAVRGPARWLRRMTLTDWSWVHFKASVIAWAALLGAYTPEKVGDALGGVITLVTTVVISGAAVSLVGLVMSAQTGRTRVVGIAIELGGLLIMAAGPVAYFGTQAYLALTSPDGDQRYALTALAYVFLAATLCRILLVLPMFNREAHDPLKQV